MVKLEECYNADLWYIEWKLLLNDPWYRLILKMMKLITQTFHGKRILEVGCGLGGFCIKIAKKGANVIGLDISLSAIKKAKSLAKQSEVQSQVDFIIGDARFLPFKDLSNEIVVCSETLEHVTNYEQAFRELVRVTEKSGYLCVTVPNLLSTLSLTYLVDLAIGQPQYVKRFLSVEKEHIFYLHKVRKLFDRKDLKIIEIRGTDFLHLPVVLKKTLKKDSYLKRFSDRLENYGQALRLFGSNIGVLAKKE